MERKMQYKLGMGKRVKDFYCLAWWTIWRRFNFLLDDRDNQADLKQIIELSALKAPPDIDIKEFSRELERELYQFSKEAGFIKHLNLVQNSKNKIKKR